jgi:hypothetical protein
MRGELLLQIGVDDTGLHTSGARCRIDFQDLVQPGQIDHHQVRPGHHARAAVRRPTSDHQRDFLLAGHAHDGDHLVARARAQQQPRSLTETPIILAAFRQRGGIGDDLIWAAERGGERGDD